MSATHRLDLWDGTQMDYVRRYYDVPAAIGMRIVFDGRPVTIVGAEDARLVVAFDDGPDGACLHPTWRVDYLDGRGGRAR